jgi:hypothetical protein
VVAPAPGRQLRRAPFRLAPARLRNAYRPPTVHECAAVITPLAPLNSPRGNGAGRRRRPRAKETSPSSACPPRPCLHTEHVAHGQVPGDEADPSYRGGRRRGGPPVCGRRRNARPACRARRLLLGLLAADYRYWRRTSITSGTCGSCRDWWAGDVLRMELVIPGVRILRSILPLIEPRPEKARCGGVKVDVFHRLASAPRWNVEWT